MDLPNVVKQGSRFDLLDLSGGQAQLDGDSPESSLTRTEWPDVYGSLASMALTINCRSS